MMFGGWYEFDGSGSSTLVIPMLIVLLGVGTKISLGEYDVMLSRFEWTVFTKSIRKLVHSAPLYDASDRETRKSTVC